MIVVEDAVVILMVLGVVVIGVALVDLIVVETVVGVIKMTKMIGQNHLPQVNVWNSEYYKLTWQPFSETFNALGYTIDLFSF